MPQSGRRPQHQRKNDRKLELRDFPDPTPGPRDVVLEIKASGMCGSDLHVYRASFKPGDASSDLRAAPIR